MLIQIKIPEQHFFLLIDSLLYGIHIIEDLLIGMLSGFEVDNVAFEDLRTMAAAQVCDLINQLRGLLFCNKTSSLYGVQQDFKLRNAEAAILLFRGPQRCS